MHSWIWCGTRLWTAFRLCGRPVNSDVQVWASLSVWDSVNFEPPTSSCRVGQRVFTFYTSDNDPSDFNRCVHILVSILVFILRIYRYNFFLIICAQVCLYSTNQPLCGCLTQQLRIHSVSGFSYSVWKWQQQYNLCPALQKSWVLYISACEIWPEDAPALKTEND